MTNKKSVSRFKLNEDEKKTIKEISGYSGIDEKIVQKICMYFIISKLINLIDKKFDNDKNKFKFTKMAIPSLGDLYIDYDTNKKSIVYSFEPKEEFSNTINEIISGQDVTELREYLEEQVINLF